MRHSCNVKITTGHLISGVLASSHDLAMGLTQCAVEIISEIW